LKNETTPFTTGNDECLNLVVATSQPTFEEQGLKQMLRNHQEELKSSEQSRSSAGVNLDLERLDEMFFFVDQTRLVAISDKKLTNHSLSDSWEFLKECKFNVNSFAIVKIPP